MYFDSHAHFDDVQYDDDRHQLIEDMHQNGVDFIINSCELKIHESMIYKGFFSC